MVVKIIIGVVIGIVLGGLLGSTRSCEDGGCPLTANPLRGSIYGGVMGLLFTLSVFSGVGKDESIFERKKKLLAERRGMIPLTDSVVNGKDSITDCLPRSDSNLNSLSERRDVMSEKVLQLNEQNFDGTIKDGVTLVDFWAPWCGPCQQQIPILDELAEKITDGQKIAKCNVDDNSSIAARYGVQSIPTLLVFKDGEIVKQFVGVQQLSTLRDALESVVATR